jgi:hypothetical protein
MGLLFDKILVNSPAKWLTFLLNYLTHRSALADAINNGDGVLQIVAQQSLLPRR